MLRRTMFALALVAGLLAAGLAAPTHAAAAQTAQVHCEVSGGGGLNPPYDYWIDAYATYDSVPDNPGFRQWTGYHFRLDGVVPPGNHSNVNIRLYDGNVLIFSWNSPDNIQPRVWYADHQGGIHYTTNSAVDDVVSFQAIFDRPRRSDPNCTTQTPPV